MSQLLLGQPPKLCLRRPVFVRASPLLCNGLSSSSLQSPPCFIQGADPCGADLGKLIIYTATERTFIHLDKKVPMDLVYNDGIDTLVTIGSSHGWIATLKDDGILRLQDDLNPVASDLHPKRLPLPPLVTLPHCQTRIITNVSLSSPSPEEQDCIVAVKFLGPQLSFCRPAAGESNPEWINIRINNPCFFSSRVMFSKKDDMFRIAGSGGHLIGSWDLHKHKHTSKLLKLQYHNLPKLSDSERELLHSCCTSEHLVESPSTGETFLVKQYKKTDEIVKGIARLKTQSLMVFKLDDEGNAVYTDNIGDLVIFLSKSEPFCVPASSFPGLFHSKIYLYDVDEVGIFNLSKSHYVSKIYDVGCPAPYYIPPQNISLGGLSIKVCLSF
ncbi:unnamed protein product [Microthlaspi erraticum]|uniref:KIB1-4 beta-propeller domain-containing protein n=1 Tax=Microthlaspi erraticum TaxID=1685480 RepID=A0A6D2J184_9BRAS|nr:unnamed protein product [Microthlaspi erraticum]